MKSYFFYDHLKYLFFSLFCFSIVFATESPRQDILLNENWEFEGKDITGNEIHQTVNLPHTWNSHDAQEGFAYYRGPGVYTKKLMLRNQNPARRYFLKFEGANTVADVFINGQHVGQHRGGYAAFIFEITAFAQPGTENTIVVKVDNSLWSDVIPIAGDFNLYGGLYRPVHLLVTQSICISPLDYASPGVYLIQEKATDAAAIIQAKVVVSNGTAENQAIKVKISIFDQTGKLVNEQWQEAAIPQNSSRIVSKQLVIENPHLWAGRKDPYCYSTAITLQANGKVIDEIHQHLGLRYFELNPATGFTLNGLPLKLKGVNRHQDYPDKGSALSNSDHRRDLSLILEMGTNAIRLAHYQHSDYFYHLCDSTGLVTWAEIPLVGSLSSGYNTEAAFQQNVKQQLTELIRQNFNHPSIIFWGLYNELRPIKGDSVIANLMKELNQLAKQEDPARLTTAASMLDDPHAIDFITDAIAWNKYFGWYFGQTSDFGKWADGMHEKYPDRCIGVSEYGAGGSVLQHEEILRRPFPVLDFWHPEAWQNYYHEEHWRQIESRPFIWGSFIWNMFDFGSCFRREGDAPGINDKGLVTYNRQVKKDAFYFYKANWSDEPVIYIADRRYKLRESAETTVKVYSNLVELELFVNNTSLGKITGGNVTFKWAPVHLQRGNNIIKVTGMKDHQQFQDVCVWIYDGPNIFTTLFPFLKWWIKPVAVTIMVLLILFFLGGYLSKYKKWKRRFCKICFYLTLVIALLMVVLFIYAWQYGFNLFQFSVI
ncbi:DUF4982 domain-containing protein [candidate division KSB1 bacterium]|nr:DUF4982 domain-containing protein [candidate division KSB1 bacterium]